jgi:hypothetical protein
MVNVDVGLGFRGGEFGDFHDSGAAPFELDMPVMLLLKDCIPGCV